LGVIKNSEKSNRMMIIKIYGFYGMTKIL